MSARTAMSVGSKPGVRLIEVVEAPGQGNALWSGVCVKCVCLCFLFGRHMFAIACGSFGLCEGEWAWFVWWGMGVVCVVENGRGLWLVWAWFVVGTGVVCGRVRAWCVLGRGKSRSGGQINGTQSVPSTRVIELEFEVHGAVCLG